MLGVVPSPENPNGIEPWQREFLEAVASGDEQIAVRSGHGVGKSAVLAWLIVWHICTRFPQKTICTAASADQLFDGLAAEVKTWIKRLPALVQEHFLEVQVDHIYFKPSREESFVSFRVSKAETPEALAGTHSKHVLLVGDEASGIPDPIFDAAAGSMSGGIPGESVQMVLAGNPVRTSGFFFDIFNKPAVSALWKLFHVSCAVSGRVGPKYREQQRAKYGGEDTNGFRVRYLGEFPKTEDDTLIPYELVNDALTREVQPIATRPVWGVDCARFGSDRSALAIRVGNVLKDKVKVWKDLNTMQLAGEIKFLWDSTLPSERPHEICVDVIGIGAGVVDRLAELGLPARGVNVAESPALTDRFANLKAELWWTAREFFEKRDSNLANDEDLLAELTAVKYFIADSSGKVRVEGKNETRKRMGRSPDKADAFILTFAATAMSALHGSTGSFSSNQPLKRGIKGLV